MESVTHATRALLNALGAEGVERATLNQVGPASGFGHYSVVLGGGLGSAEEINEFVNRLRPHL